MPDDEIVQGLQDFFPRTTFGFGEFQGQQWIVAPPDAAIPVLRWLKLEAGFDMLIDLTAVDYPARPARFELVYTLYSFAAEERIRLKSLLAEDEPAETAVNVFRGANWLEREVFDMFGIVFTGHPNLTRILMPEDWTGFPLRKEYSITGQDVRWVTENLGPQAVG